MPGYSTGDLLVCLVHSTVNAAAAPVFATPGQWDQFQSGSLGHLGLELPGWPPARQWLTRLGFPDRGHTQRATGWRTSPTRRTFRTAITPSKAFTTGAGPRPVACPPPVVQPPRGVELPGHRSVHDDQS